METIKKIFDWLVGKSWLTKLLILASAVLIACAFLFTSCASWKGATIGGFHKVDKVVKDSLYYESTFEK